MWKFVDLETVSGTPNINEGIMSKLRQLNRFRSTHHKMQLSFWQLQIKEDEIYYNAWYQREYVWTEKEQVEFIQNLIMGLPVGEVSVVLDTTYKEGVKYIEVVDGKQRLITLKKYFNDEVVVWGQVYSDLLPADKRFLGNMILPYTDLSAQSEKEKLEYFYRINFSGVPQSESHKQFIEEQLNLNK